MRLCAVAAVLAVLSLAAFAGGATTVTQKARAFSVSAVQIVRGDTIQFTNTDLFVHQIYVESPDFTYESDEQPPETNVNVTFPKAGLFEVRCHIHPKMLLHVDVR